MVETTAVETATWRCSDCERDVVVMLGEDPESCFCGGYFNSRVFVVDGAEWVISLEEEEEV